MKAFMLLTGSGPLMVLTSHPTIVDSVLETKFEAMGIDKFIAYEVPVDVAEARYGGHFGVVRGDQHESDDLRILDTNGDRAFRLFEFSELKEPVYWSASRH